MAIHTEGDGDPVVIAGGGPGVGNSHYHDWFAALADRFTLAYFDYEGITIEGYGEQIETVRRELGADRVSVIGLSFGGMPALAYALRHPDLLDRLVLSNAQISAATWQERNIDAVNRSLREHYPERWARLLELRDRGVRSLDGEVQGFYGDLLVRLEWADPAHRPELRHGEPPNIDVYAAVAGEDPEWEVGGTMAGFDPDLGAVAAPTLVITGRWDGLDHAAARVRDRRGAAERRACDPRAQRPSPVVRGARRLLRARRRVPQRRSASSVMTAS